MEQVLDLKISDKDWAKMPIVTNRPNSEKEEKHLRELITCEFSNIEEPGMSLQFSYGDTRFSKRINLFHGGRYRVPRFIQRHVESCSTPIYSWRPDGKGSMMKERIGTKSRFQMREVF